MRHLLLAIGLAAFLSATLTAADESQLELKTERIIVFKDGYSLVIKRGAATTDKDGEVFTNEVPDSAVLGSFWATPKEGRMTSMVAGWVETEEEFEKQIPCTQVVEILKANVGKKCITYLKDKTVVAGKVEQVLTNESKTLLPDSLRETFGLLVSSRQSSLEQTQVQSETVTSISGSHFIVQTDDGDVVVGINDVARFLIDDINTSITKTVKTKKRTKRLRFRFAEEGKRRELTIMYFRPGVRWIPTYRVNLTTNKKKEKVAQIAMQAEIVNAAEVLKDTKMDIVVGVPNFRYRSAVSPLVLESTLRKTVANSLDLRNSIGNNSFSNTNYPSNGNQFVATHVVEGARADGGIVDLPSELTAGRSQDLFVYNLPPLDLKNGERSAVPILTTEVPYRDVYTWELHVKKNDNATSPSATASPLQIAHNQVWRQIELVNNTKMPWTTGAAMIMDGQQPLAQEMLTYTSSGNACRVPVTISIDTRGRFTEHELSRQLRALTWDQRNYAKIKQEATPTLYNNKSEEIKAEITLRFGGKADKTSDDGKVVLASFRSEDWQRYRGDPAVNNSSVVRWNVTIKPGETFSPKVEYSYYTRQ